MGSGEDYEVVESGLVDGALAYIDRSYTFTDIPAYLEAATYIKTANDDKVSVGDDFLSLDVNQDVTVYVAHDDLITDKPSWLLDFTDTGDQLVTTDKSLSIYAKNFPAGTVTLGGKLAEGAVGQSSNYTVSLKPLAPFSIMINTPQSLHFQVDDDLFVQALTGILQPGWGVSIVIDMGTTNEQGITDFSKPYEAVFLDLEKNEHTVDVFIIDNSSVEVPGPYTIIKQVRLESVIIMCHWR